MNKFISTTVLGLFLLISPVQADIVVIDSEQFSDKWSLYDHTSQNWVQRYVKGVKTFDLAPGRYYILIGLDTKIFFTVDAAGLVVVENGISAQGGANQLTLITSEVNFEPGEYTGSTWITWGSFIAGPHSRFLPKGLSYRIFPGSASHSLNFTLAADGSVSTQQSSSFDVVGNTMFFKTVPVNIDPGSYEGTTRLIGSSGQFGMQQHHLVPGTTYRLQLATDLIDFLLSETGQISVFNEDAATVNELTHTLSYNNVEVTFNTNQYAGESNLFYAGPKQIGSHKRILVPGIKYSLAVGSTAGVKLTLDAQGNATSYNEIAFTTSGRTVTYNNVEVTIDTAGFTGNYSLYGVGAWQTFSGSRTITLVPNLSYLFNISASRHTFSINENSILSAPEANSWYQVNQSTLKLNTSAVTIDVPAFYTNDWNIGGYVRQGTDTITLVEGTSYYAYSAGRGVFDLLSPCAFSPETFTIKSGIAFTGSCGTPVIDSDFDGIPDSGDNCPFLANPDQLDLNNDGEGDLCDTDIDGDSVSNDVDNCPAIVNTDQTDDDGDAIGNPCDDDDDNDSVNDSFDNCPYLANPDQADGDADSLGNVCDPDDDNDFIEDVNDNCPATANVNQSDIDSDGFGDVCDNDIDGDLVNNELDQCPSTPPGLIITNKGCSGLQFITMSCKPEDFSNHGKFVSCVSHVSKDLDIDDVITSKERARFIKEAAKK